MNPEMEIVKAVQVLPSQAENVPKGTAVISLGTKRGRWVREHIPGVVKVKATKPPANPLSNKLPPAETEDQKKSFEYYMVLGSERSLKKVAEHFTVKLQTISIWSSKFHWVERVTKLENLPEVEIAKRKLAVSKKNLSEFYLLKTGKMVIPDPENSGKMMPNPDFSGNAAKEITAGVVALDKDIREKEAHEKEMDRGPGGGIGGRGKGGVMVNVVIQK